MSLGAAATPHEQSTLAAIEALRAGGNAVDAAIAAVVTQGVVAPETCGLGGDLFALVHGPGYGAEPKAINASGRAGEGARSDGLRAEGQTEVPRDSALAVTIPGCVDGLLTLHQELGTSPLESLFAHGIGLAEGGFTASTSLSRAFASQAGTYRDNPAVSDLYPSGRAIEPGDVVRRPSLASTLRRIVSDGREGFYLGEPGDDIISAVGGLISRRDLTRLQSEWVSPIGTMISGLVAWSVPPNSQGYLGPASLAVFERLQPPTDESDPLWWHLLVESYRSVAWERNDLVADPDHAPLPSGQLMSDERLDRAAGSINPDLAGTWPQPAGSWSDTAYLCVCDGDGMGVSIIQSNYRGTGSPFGAARSGFLLQDRGSGFSLVPGHPNEIAPGKRPLHTLAPTLWTEGDRARWLLGTRGGAVQPQLVAQLGARAIIGGLGLDQAQALPRWTIPHFGPGAESHLQIEPGVDDAIVDDLRRRGHHVNRLDENQPGWGPMSIIDMGQDPPRAAGDPRVDTTAAALA